MSKWGERRGCKFPAKLCTTQWPITPHPHPYFLNHLSHPSPLTSAASLPTSPAPSAALLHFLTSSLIFVISALWSSLSDCSSSRNDSNSDWEQGDVLCND